MVNIAFVLNAFSQYGGAETTIKRILKYIDKAEYSITVFLPNKSNKSMSADLGFKVEYYDWRICEAIGFIKSFRFLKQKHHLIKQLKFYDVIHFQMLHTSLMLAPFFYHSNVIVSPRGGDIQDPKKTDYLELVKKSQYPLVYKGFRTNFLNELFLIIYFYLYKNKYKFVTMSNDMIGELRSFGVINPFLISTGVDVDYFKTQLGADAVEKNTLTQFKVLSVGRNDSRKGFFFLIDACESLIAKGVLDVRFIVKGRSFEVFKEILISKGLSEYFTLVDLDFNLDFNIPAKRHDLLNTPDNQTLSLYNFCDIVVIPSIIEGLPNVGIESIAAGKPAIVSDTFGCHDLFIGGGVLKAKVGDGSSIAANIIRLKTDKDLYRKLQFEQIKKQKQIDMKVIVQKYMELYEK